MKIIFIYSIFLSDSLNEAIKALEPKCDSSKSDYDCCKTSDPCGVGEGDCDIDADCEGDLVCAKDNCINLDSSWADSDFDCCIHISSLPTTTDIPETSTFLDKTTQPGPGTTTTAGPGTTTTAGPGTTTTAGPPRLQQLKRNNV